MLDGNLIHIRQVGGRLEYRSGTDLDALLRSYFRLDDDINAVLSELSARDEKIATLVKKHPHLRVLRQLDPLGVHGCLHMLGDQQRRPNQSHCGERRGATRKPAGA